MKANELRLGNWVKWEAIYFRMVSISEEMPVLSTIEFSTDKIEWNEIEPIPITEEWLVGFGLKITDSNIIKDGYILSKINGRNFRLNLKYVHQLQNLYFALTGKELTLNE